MIFRRVADEEMASIRLHCDGMTQTTAGQGAVPLNGHTQANWRIEVTVYSITELTITCYIMGANGWKYPIYLPGSAESHFQKAGITCDYP